MTNLPQAIVVFMIVFAVVSHTSEDTLWQGWLHLAGLFAGVLK